MAGIILGILKIVQTIFCAGSKDHEDQQQHQQLCDHVRGSVWFAEVVLVRCGCVGIYIIVTCVAEFHKAAVLEDWGFAVLFRRLFAIARTASNLGFLAQTEGRIPTVLFPSVCRSSCGLCFVCM